MNINIFFKGYKHQNNYSNRGNYFGAKSIKNNVEMFKKFVLNFKFNLDNNIKKANKLEKEYSIRNNLPLDEIDPKLFHKENIIRIEDIFQAINVNMICCSEMTKIEEFDKMKEPHINICNIQNGSHREVIIAYSRLYNKGETEYDIIYDRNLDKRFVVPGFNYYSNGLTFSKKHNKNFLPRYFGTIFDKTKDEKTRIGIYFRPDVCPLGVNHIVEYLEQEAINAKKQGLYQHLPTIIQYGQKIEINYPFMAHTNNNKEFFENTDMYLYSPMECEDPLPNTLFEACLNGKDIIILNSNPRFKGLDGIKDVEQLAQYVYDQPFNYITNNMDLISTINDIKLLNSFEHTIVRKKKMQILFERIIVVSNLIFLSKIFNNIFSKYVFTKSDKEMINNLLMLYSLENTFKDFEIRRKNMTHDEAMKELTYMDEISELTNNIMDRWFS